MSDPLRFLASFLADSADTIQEMCNDQCQTPEGIWALIACHTNVLQAELGNHSVLDVLAVNPTPTSSAPPPAPPPQEELWLLRTSFDIAFALLASQVKELAAKVNSSRPPPKAAAAQKPSAQPPSKPHAQPPTAPAPTPASCPAPPSFASVVKAPARPSLVVSLHPSVPGADVPLAIH